MGKDGDVKRAIVNQRDLPPMFPTHGHAAQFWEALGRAIATFGFLEETLGKPFFQNALGNASGRVFVSGLNNRFRKHVKWLAECGDHLPILPSAVR